MHMQSQHVLVRDERQARRQSGVPVSNSTSRSSRRGTPVPSLNNGGVSTLRAALKASAAKSQSRLGVRPRGQRGTFVAEDRGRGPHEGGSRVKQFLPYKGTDSIAASDSEDGAVVDNHHEDESESAGTDIGTNGHIFKTPTSEDIEMGSPEPIADSVTFLPITPESLENWTASFRQLLKGKTELSREVCSLLHAVSNVANP